MVRRASVVVYQAAGILSLAVLGCSAPAVTPDPVAQAKCRIVASFDADCDGVYDQYDQLPGIPDYGDTDGDLIYNAIDVHPGIDDKVQDADRDYVPDYLDDYAGNNYADDDLDRIPNGIDLQPTVALSPGQPPTAQDNRSLSEMIVLNSMRTDQTIELLDRGPDSDLDSIPDSIDLTPDWWTNDKDLDRTPDRFDPVAGNPYVTEEYDPWDPASGAYYEDPYDPSNDAYWEDD